MGMNGHNETVPIVLQPRPPLPDDVALAATVFGTEAGLALLEHYRQAPGPQRDAAEALGMTKQTASRHTNTLHEAGVIYQDPNWKNRREGRWMVDSERVAFLLDHLRAYTLGEG